MEPGSDSFVDDFDGPDLDADVWIPHYLPMWSSRAESYSLDGRRRSAPPEASSLS
jgi:hypothetical protein